MSQVTLQCQGVPFGPKWAGRAQRLLRCSVGQAGIQVFQGRGRITVSFHLSEINVEAGQEVRKGNTIGLVGTT